MNPAPRRTVLAGFTAPEALSAACARLRAEGYTLWETYTPSPLPGLTPPPPQACLSLTRLACAGGLAGALLGLGLQVYAHVWGSPYRLSGKPAWSWPAFLPVAFELALCGAALAVFTGWILSTGLARRNSPLFACPAFRRASRDRFFLAIPATDPRFSEEETPRLLRALGAETVDYCAAEEARGAAPARLLGWLLWLAAAALPFALLFWIRSGPHELVRPRWYGEMAQQPRPRPQGSSLLFPDGRASRPAVPGTIRADLPWRSPEFLSGKSGGRYVTRLPLPLGAPLLAQGRERYNIYCSGCHGLSGQGDGPVNRRAEELQEGAWVPAAQLTSDYVRTQTPGQLFETVTEGLRRNPQLPRTMPAQGDLLTAEERWAVLFYLRALQRCFRARIEDFPEELRREYE